MEAPISDGPGRPFPGAAGNFSGGSPGRHGDTRPGEEPISSDEVFARKFQQLAVAWMIERFNAYQSVDQIVMTLMNMFDQFEFCVGGADNQYLGDTT